VVFGLSQVANEGGFRGASVWDTLIGGLVLVALFVLRSTKALEPLIDMRLFKDRTFSVASIGIFLTGATLYGTMFLLPLYYQVDRGDAAWKAGLMMAPQGIGAAIVMRYAGSLSDRKGPRYVAAFGMALLALGTFFYTGVSATSSYYFLGLALFVRGIGLGFGMMPVFAASYRNLTHQNVPKATSATNIIRQIGGSLGVAVFAVVLQTQIAQRFPMTGAQLQAGLITPTANDLQKIATAFGHSFWWSFGTCALGIVPALFLPRTGIAKREGESVAVQAAD
jgi:MFS family permease